MKVIKNNLNETLKPIDDKIIKKLSRFVLSIKKENSYNEIYEKLYESKYKNVNLIELETKFRDWLENQIIIYKSKLTTDFKGKHHNLIKINEKKLNFISYSFYLAPNPENMHEILKKLIQKLSEDNVSVIVKYQKESKLNHCDRIIIHTDIENRDKVENSIAKVYSGNSQLFKGGERALSWIYNTSIPNVYLSSENINTSYCQKFITTMREAKDIFCYLYGLTNSQTKISIKGIKEEQTIDTLNIITLSLLLRNNLLLNNNNNRIKNKEGKITTKYDYHTGILINRNESSLNSITAKYFPTNEDRKYLLENFYGIPSNKQQKKLYLQRKRVKL